jgi:hypothetical protein
MPGDLKINTKLSAATYQDIAGPNFTTVGVDNSIKVGNGCLGLYTGVGTSFNGKPITFVGDIKGSMPYGDTCLSGGFRVRNKLNQDSQTVQLRVQPLTVTVPVAKNTNIYTTPYVATNINYKTGDPKTSFGNFTGVSTKVGKASVFVEGQLYDLTKVNKNTIGVNAGVSIPIGN